MSPGAAEAALAHLFDGRVLARLGPARYGLEDLTPPEQAVIERAIPSRQREYATARVIARQLLEPLGYGRHTIASGSDRAPLWPVGVTGSIAHADGMCFVAVSGSPTIAAVGVDIEPAPALEPELWAEICNSSELEWINERPEQERGWWARVVFCAKEAFYKCQYAVTGERLTFSDVATTLRPHARNFEARLVISAGRLPPGFALSGRFAEVDGWILTGVICTQSDLDGARAGD